ncbi:PAS domain-containing protein, partial [bacterium AH-315-K03]|nr:PAS domain-containing protein [bacterium AH-315-K03]
MSIDEALKPLFGICSCSEKIMMGGSVAPEVCCINSIAEPSESPIFNALILIVGVFALLVRGNKKGSQLSMSFLILAPAIFAIAAYAITYYCATSANLPQTIFPNAIVSRPYDVIPLILYLISGLIIFPALYRRRPSLLIHILIISTIPQIVTQLHMVFGSSALYDNDFNIAHFMKIIAYLIPCSGLIFEYIKTQIALKEEISRRQLVMAQLQHSEERFQLAVDGSSDGIWDWNILTDKVYYSERTKEMLGITTSIPIEYKKFWQELVHPKDQEATSKAFQEHFLNKTPCRIECRIHNTTTGYQWYLIRGEAARNDAGKAIRMAGSLTDISENKKIEKMKNEFISMVSHELRTPLTSIRGSLGIISGGVLGELPHKIQKMIDIATNN